MDDSKPKVPASHWDQRDAKSRLGELARLRGDRNGQALVDALQSSPHRDVQLIVVGVQMPVREAAL